MNLSLNNEINFANDMDNTNEIEMFSPEEMQSPFEAIKETDGEGREWWNSRKLARLMGYQKGAHGGDRGDGATE